MDNQKSTSSNQLQQSGRAFRGRFMDMVHPSSDVKNTHKENLATHRQSTVSEKESSNHQQSFEGPFRPMRISNPTKIEETDRVMNANPPQEKPVSMNRDFADEIRNAFEPTVYADEADMSSDTNSDLEQSEEPKTDEFKSPFIEGVKVDKRPLGNSVPSFDLMSGLEELELPADDGDQDHLELALPDVKANAEQLYLVESSKSDNTHYDNDNKSRETFNSLSSNNFDVRAALDNSVVTENSQDPIEHQHVAKSDNSKRKYAPNWWWLLAVILLIIAGASIGVLLYMFVSNSKLIFEFSTC